ncbi:hypothetical protein MNEG_13883 [Monoraphidium neglectum]|uniref:Uncharacterized protein n=1 Tax=Monoraphidium neglectum TaxID=145388 RepID=A0A0D2LQV6_9CHLO|nr:hypothetical protein MNEG_13883 [Monoraphidium neglectum]KIY94079.1 hypothetical protein MNEG_13883 [Monoraphidium neglectum]|eukprot:XP_013893099.1 hypothetical protein MNEG_13883 [Monoraphidium neglectum]
MAVGARSSQMRGIALLVVLLSVGLMVYTVWLVGKPLFWRIYADMTHKPSAVALRSNAFTDDDAGALVEVKHLGGDKDADDEEDGSKKDRKRKKRQKHKHEEEEHDDDKADKKGKRKEKDREKDKEKGEQEEDKREEKKGKAEADEGSKPSKADDVRRQQRRSHARRMTQLVQW